MAPRQTRRQAARNVKNTIDENPDVRMVLEIAMRLKEPPRHIGMATDVVLTCPNSQVIINGTMP
jgi:hypothetical protein